MNYTIKDNTDEFLSAFEKALENGLTAIGMTAEGHAKKARRFNLASICFQL